MSWRCASSQLGKRTHLSDRWLHYALTTDETAPSEGAVAAVTDPSTAHTYAIDVLERDTDLLASIAERLRRAPVGGTCVRQARAQWVEALLPKRKDLTIDNLCWFGPPFAPQLRSRIELARILECWPKCERPRCEQCEEAQELWQHLAGLWFAYTGKQCRERTRPEDCLMASLESTVAPERYLSLDDFMLLAATNGYLFVNKGRGDACEEAWKDPAVQPNNVARHFADRMSRQLTRASAGGWLVSSFIEAVARGWEYEIHQTTDSVVDHTPESVV